MLAYDHLKVIAPGKTYLELFSSFSNHSCLTIFPKLDASSSLRLFFSSIIDKLRNSVADTSKTGSDTIIKVILADDDPDDRELFAEAIENIDARINVQVVSNGLELFETLQSGYKPHMIFLDLNMPGRNGKECLTDLRAAQHWSDIPVVIYSTSNNKKDVTETYERGANLYLQKPSSFTELIKLIRIAFSIDWNNRFRLPDTEFLLSKNS